MSFELSSAYGYRKHEKRTSKERMGSAEEDLTETASMASSACTNEDDNDDE